MTNDEQIHDATGKAEFTSPENELNSALTESETEFVTEQKKPLNKSAFIMFGLVVLGIGGMYFMHLRSGPKAANAASVAEVAAADTTIKEFLDSKGENIRLMETMLSSTEKVVQQFLNYPSANQVPLGDLRTNPFRFETVKNGDAQNDTADKKRREEERVAILKAVQGLDLQSVMHGEARKTCMINNSLYQEGQEVQGFVIEKINPKAIVVKNGPYRFELRMQK